MVATSSSICREKIPESLTSRPQWVVWKLVTRDDDKPTKVPFSTNRRGAKANDPTTWDTLEAAWEAYESDNYSGVGYMFAADDPFCGIDLDGCRDPESGKVADWAREVIKKFASYSEVSPSGTGVKIFCLGKSPFSNGRKIPVKGVERMGDKEPAIEVYDNRRYFAVTGWRLEGGNKELSDGAEPLAWLKTKYSPDVSSEPFGYTTSEYQSQDAVIDRARKYLAKIEGAVTGCGGHNQTFHAACVLLLDFELSESDALVLLSEWNQSCQPPWSEAELIHKVQSASQQPGPRGRLRNANPATWDRIKVQYTISPEDVPVKWDAIVPFDLVPEVLPFPVQVFPADIQQFINEGSLALNCPPDYLALPMLGVAGSAIGNSRWVAITNTHLQGPCIFGCVVGSKGTAKSPALQLVTAPLRKAQREFKEQYDRELLGWEERPEKERGREPILRRCIVGDSTTETLSIRLNENPRGLAIVRDELSGLLASMNQYKGGMGHDRQWYLELWSQTLSPRDRKSDKGPPVMLDRAMASVIGNTQPDVVKKFRGEAQRGSRPPDDGFVDRWLFAMPDELPARGETWDEVSEAASFAWNDMIRRLLNLTGVDDGDSHGPLFLRLTPDARNEWAQLTSALAAEVNSEDFPDLLDGAYAKLRGYAGRLALVVHVMNNVKSEAREEIDSDSIKKAGILLEYFKSHIRRVYSFMSADSSIESAQKILEWVKREGRTTFKRGDAYGDLKSQRWFPDVNAMDKPLEMLVEHNFIREKAVPSKPGPGRKPAPLYEVNPSLSTIL